MYTGQRGRCGFPTYHMCLKFSVIGTSAIPKSSQRPCCVHLSICVCPGCPLVSNRSHLLAENTMWQQGHCHNSEQVGDVGRETLCLLSVTVLPLGRVQYHQ